MRHRVPNTFGQNEHKPFAINVRHFKCCSHKRSSQTGRVSLLDRRREADVLTAGWLFQNRPGTQRNRPTRPLTSAPKRRRSLVEEESTRRFEGRSPGPARGRARPRHEPTSHPGSPAPRRPGPDRRFDGPRSAGFSSVQLTIASTLAIQNLEKRGTPGVASFYEQAAIIAQLRQDRDESISSSSAPRISSSAWSQSSSSERDSLPHIAPCIVSMSRLTRKCGQM